MAAKFALIGGDEFAPEFEETTAGLLAEAGASAGLVVFLPTAAAWDGPEAAEEYVARAKAYLGKLGARVEVASVLDRESANAPSATALIAQANLIYLGGGKPQALLQILGDSLAWRAILEAHRRGALLVGSSAGAMILGGVTLLPEGQFEVSPETARVRIALGFGLLRNVAILPHMNLFREAIAKRLPAEAPHGLAIIGIDEQTALLGDGARWDILGRGEVMIYQNGVQRFYRAGQCIELPIAK